ncbi:hypothetical protein MHTCC0001_09710 [Flavobacteriaceae bacterium MHTCC 0001]
MNDHLNRVLFQWDKYQADFHDVRMATTGVLVLGSSGSAKTTSSGALLAGHYLKNGFGFLVLTCKEDESQLWRNYCKAYNREKDLVVFGPNSNETFNFFEYEANRSDTGTGIAHNIADVLKTIIKAGSDDGHQNDKAFWDSNLQKLLVNAVELALLTNNKKFEHIYKIIQSAPRNLEQVNKKEWQKSSTCFKLMHHAAQNLESMESSPEVKEKIHTLRLIEHFFYKEWTTLSEKTRSIIYSMFTAFGDRFLRNPLKDLFGTTTTIKPEDTFSGKIIVVDLPILVYDKIGKDAQILWKYMFQRAVQRRKIVNTSRPVCLFADEFQNFIFPEFDPLFQSTARAYRVCTVYITQNLPNFYLQAGGGDIGRTRFRALAGNLSTKIFHANSDPETNEYASDLIGKDYRWTNNKGETYGDGLSFNQGQAESLEYIVPPSTFTKLKTGGSENDFIAEAIVHRHKTFESTRENHKNITLKQILL